ncbi:MAG TPA: acyl-CoA dehydrogenase [Thiotrichales bacterium]|nr:acyl-CoA dehydrogenase [Thiotrichales bacterium]
MITALEIVLVVASFWAIAYHRLPGWSWALAAAAWLLVLGLFHDAPVLLGLGWSLLVPATLVLGIPPLRRLALTRPVHAAFRAVLPPMSDTEREALEAGSVWWEGELFSGAPRWRLLLADIPPPRRSPEEQAFIDGTVEELCTMLDDWRITHELKDLPPEVWRFIKDRGFFGMIIPREYGGLGFSAQAHSDVVMKIAGRSITAAVTVMVPNSLGPAKLLLHYGTEAQKQHYLPRLARGEEVPCFALTGPEAGSDAASIPDHGVVCKGSFEGREALGIRLNWDKRYITLGPVATVLGLAFRLYDPEHLLGSEEDLGITLALIPTDTPGVEIGHRHYPLDIPFQNGPTRGRDVFIPIDWIIGGPEQVGHGWRMLMECLADGRGISLPALSAGAGKLAARATGAYAAIRRQFKTPIGRFEGVAEALARIGGNAYLMDAARELTCTALDQGERPAVVSAILKYHLTERMRETVNHAMDIQGGSGICLGPHNYLGRIYQAVPISITVEGANILTRSLIIFGQGALRCHPYLLAEMRAAQAGDAGLADFDRAFFGHLRHVLANAARALFHGLSDGRLARAPVKGAHARHFQRLSRMSAAFALAADFSLLTLGGSLKRRERLSARLGDALSYLYLGSAALKRFEDQGRPKEDEPLMHWTAQECLYRTQQALVALLDNHPNRWLARLLRLWLFPTGVWYAPPSDRLGDRVAALLLEPGAARDRLTHGLYIPDDPQDRLGRLEMALAAAVTAEPVLRKIRRAIRYGDLPKDDPERLAGLAARRGLIEPAEAEAVETAARHRRAVIAVDEFTQEELQGACESWLKQAHPA